MILGCQNRSSSRCCQSLSRPQPKRAQSLGRGARPGGLTNEDQVEERISWGEAKLGFFESGTWNHSNYEFFLVFWGILGQFSGVHVLDYRQVVLSDMPQNSDDRRAKVTNSCFKVWHWKSTIIGWISFTQTKLRPLPIGFHTPTSHFRIPSDMGPIKGPIPSWNVPRNTWDIKILLSLFFRHLAKLLYFQASEHHFHPTFESHASPQLCFVLLLVCSSCRLGGMKIQQYSYLSFVGFKIHLPEKVAVNFHRLDL